MLDDPLLTDNGKFDLKVPGWRVPEVHTTPVNSGVFQLNCVQLESGDRSLPGDEVGSGAEGQRVAPQQCLIERPASHIEPEAQQSTYCSTVTNPHTFSGL